MLTSSQKRLLIFATDSCIDALQCEQVGTNFLNGTFSTSPKGFKQTWILRSSLHNNNIGSLNFISSCCFLPEKTAHSYTLALGEIKAAAPLWNPSGFVCDFEKAEHKAIRDTFPNADIYGCHFHFDQSLLKRLRMLGPSYRTEDDLRQLLHYLYALPFVPVDDIPTAKEFFLR